MVLNKLSAKVEIEIKNGNGDLLGARLQAAYLCWRQLLQQRSDGGASLNLLKSFINPAIEVVNVHPGLERVSAYKMHSLLLAD